MPPLIARVAVFMRGKVSLPGAFNTSTAASASLSQGPQQFPHDIPVTLDAQVLCPRKSFPQAPLWFLAADLPPCCRAEESVCLKLNTDFLRDP